MLTVVFVADLRVSVTDDSKGYLDLWLSLDYIVCGIYFENLIIVLTKMHCDEVRLLRYGNNLVHLMICLCILDHLNV